ncbi:phosphoribosylanthranilate isomerase [Algoriphagus persicinus]|uniref:phosphoribosylanthranilate isomerase n=1 Tax=Algoriphagus persicinus TaxID=3108754 RepID=UPI002B3B9FE9|nr:MULTISPECIES: phosphoribosylanthranilate isomerase [unclassified Algoriphagus]MEB2782264.1 phosphoribosylanthranilate isomerase [Algoriphagus sp. C2-6-M1]MEB2783842.1 phosphoribosylanthranilate isomerase [Algoriphagus sp. E1-3-M2]
MKIKVCGMRDPENIQNLIQEVNPDWMGLIFYSKSPRYVSVDFAAEIQVAEVPKVGVFVNESIEFILSKIDEFKLAAIQLHGDESPEYVRELKLKTGKKLWKVISVGETINWETLRDYVGLVEYFLFDTAAAVHGGSGRKFNWQVLENYPFEKGFILSGGLDEESSSEVISFAEKMPQLVGVDLNSKFEDAPGLKNIEKLKSFKNNIST